MPTLDQVFNWLTTLPLGGVFAAAFAFAFVENVFPPAPADVLIALCSFIVAAEHSSFLPVYACVLAGNVGGAVAMYGVGRRYGAEGLRTRMTALGAAKREERLEGLYEQYGLAALFIGRIIPGVRGFVPIIAGAFRIPPLKALSVITAASAIWYGVLTWLAFRVGENWQEYVHEIAVAGRWGAGVGIGLALVVGVSAYVVIRRRRRAG